MKREIKFRAWNPESKEMFYPTEFNLLWQYFMPPKEAYQYWETASQCSNVPVGLMQYTGLKDKNGREIYEGDVISDGEYKFRVYWMYGGFVMKAPHWAGDMEDLRIGDDLIMQPLSDNQTMGYINASCEVIGNIYENPELL